MNKDVYKMKLHEKIEISGNLITRVPGGWIYEMYTDNGLNSNYQPVYVPFHNEFMV